MAELKPYPDLVERLAIKADVEIQGFQLAFVEVGHDAARCQVNGHFCDSGIRDFERSRQVVGHVLRGEELHCVAP